MENSPQSGEGPEITVGTVLSETYEITGLIGRGGMGAVWRARHLRLPKDVAVKVLLGASASDREVYARFRREAEVASRLGHPNIVEVTDFNTLENGTPYLVLELLSGESLGARLARGALPLDETLRITRQIASGLAAAHRQQVVHRDLKPENVFLCPRETDSGVVDHVKILDFGISKIRGSQTIQTQTATVLGTPQYMAPEQAQGKHDLIDHRTDQFSLAAMVYEMLSGRPAFLGENIAEVIYKVVYEPTPSLREAAPSVPDHVVVAVEKALAKKPQDRFPDVASFVEALSGRPLHTLDGKPAGTRGDVALAETRISNPEALASTVASGDHSAAAVAPTVASGHHGPPPVAAGSQAHVATQKVSRGKWIAVAGAAVAAVVVATVLVMKGGEPEDPYQNMMRSVAPTDEPAAASDASPAVAAETPDAEVVAADPADARVVAKKPPRPPPGRPKDPPPDEDDPPVRVSPEVKKDLDDARAALAAGEHSRAVHLATRALRNVDGKLPEAFAILVRSYCAQKDLTNVKANLRRLPRKARQKAIKACREMGVDSWSLEQ